MNARYRVSYNVKNNDGLLTEKTTMFTSLQEAFAFVKRITSSREAYGMPVIERA